MNQLLKVCPVPNLMAIVLNSIGRKDKGSNPLFVLGVSESSVVR